MEKTTTSKSMLYRVPKHCKTEQNEEPRPKVESRENRQRANNAAILMWKNILMVAIALQFLSLFFHIWGWGDRTSHKEDLLITGFVIASIVHADTDADPNIYPIYVAALPIPGILSVIWIGINVFIFRKDEFKTKRAYILMSVMNFVFALFFLVVTSLALRSYILYNGNIHSCSHLYPGLFMISLSFVLYTVAYIKLLIKH
jgi:hypothetical protein